MADGTFCGHVLLCPAPFSFCVEWWSLRMRVYCGRRWCNFRWPAPLKSCRLPVMERFGSVLMAGSGTLWSFHLRWMDSHWSGWTPVKSPELLVLFARDYFAAADGYWGAVQRDLAPTRCSSDNVTRESVLNVDDLPVCLSVCYTDITHSGWWVLFDDTTDWL